MSWRIATSLAAEQRLNAPGLCDFVVGRDGSPADYVRLSWGHAPICVIYREMSDLHRFMNAWLQERTLDDIWGFSRARRQKTR